MSPKASTPGNTAHGTKHVGQRIQEENSVWTLTESYAASGPEPVMGGQTFWTDSNSPKDESLQ